MNIVQVGCNNGDDEIYDIICNNTVNFALLIDANPYVLELTKERYKDNPNVLIENLLVMGDENEYQFIIPHFSAHPYSVHSSVYEPHIIKHNHELEKAKKINIKGVILDNIFKKYKLDTIDYLMMDCEGSDYYIIQSLTFSNYKIKKIKFEVSHFPDVETTFPKICKHLISHGYEDPQLINGDCITNLIK